MNAAVLEEAEVRRLAELLLAHDTAEWQAGRGPNPQDGMYIPRARAILAAGYRKTGYTGPPIWESPGLYFVCDDRITQLDRADLSTFGGREQALCVALLEFVGAQFERTADCDYCEDGEKAAAGVACSCSAPCWNPDCPKAAKGVRRA